jgi:hypothetical protein
MSGKARIYGDEYKSSESESDEETYKMSKTNDPGFDDEHFLKRFESLMSKKKEKKKNIDSKLDKTIFDIESFKKEEEEKKKENEWKIWLMKMNAHLEESKLLNKI